MRKPRRGTDAAKLRPNLCKSLWSGRRGALVVGGTRTPEEQRVVTLRSIRASRPVPRRANYRES